MIFRHSVDVLIVPVPVPVLVPGIHFGLLSWICQVSFREGSGMIKKKKTKIVVFLLDYDRKNQNL